MEKRKIYAGSTLLLVAICIYCSLFKVNNLCCALAFGPCSLHGDGDAEPKKTVLFLHFSPSIYTSPPFLTKDGTITNVTLTGGNYPSLYSSSVFVGFVATQFTALLKCGWARQAAISPTHWYQGHTKKKRNICVTLSKPQL